MRAAAVSFYFVLLDQIVFEERKKRTTNNVLDATQVYEFYSIRQKRNPCFEKCKTKCPRAKSIEAKKRFADSLKVKTMTQLQNLNRDPK